MGTPDNPTWRPCAPSLGGVCYRGRIGPTELDIEELGPIVPTYVGPRIGGRIGVRHAGMGCCPMVGR